jgi:muramoyltetrapeptide carboxypeptidase
MIIPKKLQHGDTIAIIATSGAVVQEKLCAGVEILQGWGLRVRVFPSCRATHEYLAGDDTTRLADIHTAFADPQIKAIFAARGGYGSARLLPHIDFALIRQNPKIFAGFSDITALHIAFNQHANLVTYHAPMPAADLPLADKKTLKILKMTLFESTKPRESAVLGQSFEGVRGNFFKSFPEKNPLTLTGGNLSVLTASLGTPFEIDTRGKFLFMEETNEPPYRVDRMLVQLKQAGKLDDAAGFLLGDFSPEGDISLAVRELLLPTKKPVITGFPAGHCMPNICLPLGAEISMESLHQVQRFAHPQK